MPSFRFLHAADLHLDTPFSGIGRSSPEVRLALREASLAAWDDLVDFAIAEEVAFVVLAGDLYDGADRGLRAQLRVRDGLRRLDDHGIASFVVHGNHDPLDGWSAIVDGGWPVGATVCPAGEVTTREVVRDGRRIATLHGVSYATARTTDNLARRFPAAAGGGFHVGVLHGTVGAQSGHAPYAPCALDDLRRPGYDYWALGHVHNHAVLGTDPWVVYSGSLQGRSPKPAETGAKGALVVDVVDDAVAEVRHVPLDRVRFATVAVDLTSAHDLADVVELVGRAGAAAADEHRGRSLVLRARLTGRGPAHRDLRRPGAGDEVLAALREAAGPAGSTTFRWWGSLVDETAEAIDRGALLRRGGFAGALVAHVDGLVEGSGAVGGGTQGGRTQGGGTQGGRTQGGGTQGGRTADAAGDAGAQDGGAQDDRMQDGRTLDGGAQNARARDAVAPGIGGVGAARDLLPAGWVRDLERETVREDRELSWPVDHAAELRAAEALALDLLDAGATA